MLVSPATVALTWCLQQLSLSPGVSGNPFDASPGVSVNLFSRHLIHCLYEDEDHDKVLLASDSDLAAAIEHARFKGEIKNNNVKKSGYAEMEGSVTGYGIGAKWILSIGAKRILRH
ncbi:hypothetical protein V2J09_016172 [Rumex salicifolius]